MICIDLHNNVMDLFYGEENLWFVQWWKCLMLWYWEEEKELQYSMNSSREVLNKRQWGCWTTLSLFRNTYQVFDVKMEWWKIKIELVEWFLWKYHHCLWDWINKKRNDQVLLHKYHMRIHQEVQFLYPMIKWMNRWRE